METRELEMLRKIFLRAETEIINEIARLRQRGLIDYHVVEALQRVQNILRGMQDEVWKYTPRMIEKYFYVANEQAYTRAEKTALQHLMGYINAAALTFEQTDIVNRLVQSMMDDLEEASDNVVTNLEEFLVGRIDKDIYRTKGLEMAARIEATGSRVNAPKDFVEELRREGISCFIDKAGRHWSLHNYCTMVARTTTRQAEVLSVLTANPDQDLYMIKPHGTTCKLCAPYEGRVYSKSGKSKDFPPLADAFGKIDKNGPNELTNTYLNIHPNCLHVLIPWTEAGRSSEEIKKVKESSNPNTNPYSKDPRSESQIEAYRAKEEGRRKFLQSYHEWEDMRMAMPGKVPTFQTFLRHKIDDDDRYKSWREEYKKL